MAMKILLHICCAPCSIYPFSRLINKGFEIKGFYYNPNIYPADEYSKRKDALGVLSKDLELDVDYPQYQQDDFFQAIAGKEDVPDRCLICCSLRLRKTAKKAKEESIRAFSTTLLVSPYQNHERLKEIGAGIAKESGIDFYYEDFRVGFKEAYKEAKNRGFYLQKYCGCKYSIKNEK